MGTDGMGRRVLLLGGCGAGKTTFGKKLADKTGLPLTHLDALGWTGNWEKTPADEFDARVAEIIAGESWIIDGNWSRTIPMRLARADTVFWFDFSGIRCLAGVLRRFIKDYGKTREDMGGNCPERLDREKLKFFRYALFGRRKQRRRIADALRDAPHVRVISFRTRKQADRFLAGLEDTPEEDMPPPGKA